jgi:hypothetical protein
MTSIEINACSRNILFKKSPGSPKITTIDFLKTGKIPKSRASLFDLRAQDGVGDLSCKIL